MRGRESARRLRAVGLTTAFVAMTGCLGLFVVGPVVVAEDLPPGTTSSVLSDQLDRRVGPPRPPGLRQLPLLSPDGIAERGLADYRVGSGAAREELRPLIRQVGLATGMDEEAVDFLIALAVDVEFATSEAPSETVMDTLIADGVPAYPYRYPGVDEYVDLGLTPELVETHTDLLVDLAGLLVVYEAATHFDVQIPVAVAPSVMAYSLLRRASELVDDCDVATQLELVTALGLHAPIDTVSELADKADSLCDGDPTPLWILGTVASTQASVGSTFLETNHTPADLARIADTTFATLADEYPDSPLGPAGRGDLFLHLADEGERIGGIPFTVNRLRRDALSHYDEARKRSDDPALLVGQARALSGLGEHGAAGVSRLGRGRRIRAARPSS
jgi:hypothetical protein